MRLTCSASDVVILFLYSFDIVDVDVEQRVGVELEALHASKGQEARRVDEPACLSYGRRGVIEHPLSQQDALPYGEGVNTKAVDELCEVATRSV